MPGVSTGERVAPVTFRLEELVVDASRGMVSGPGGTVHLEPRVMSVLQALARTPGQAVSRSELLAGIWPGGDIYDEALTQAIYQLRQALVGAGGDGCRGLVETVPKKGYLLTGDVQEMAPPAGMPAWRRPAVMVPVLLVLVLSAWAATRWVAHRSAVPQSPTTTLAVLPFQPLLDELRDPALELGMADALIDRLGTVEGLAVRPLASVRRYAAPGRDVLQAGRELQVGAVVDGSIQRDGELIRVTARLLRMPDGAVLWVRSFDEAFSDIFGVQDAICARITEALIPELSRRENAGAPRHATTDSRAYDLYLRARFHSTRLNPQDMQAGIGYYREALTLDPGYSLAWLGLAGTLLRMPLAGEMPPMQFYPEAKAAALRSLELDASLVEAHADLGWIAFWYDWDWQASEQHFRQALTLDPDDPESHLGYAHLLSNTGRHEEALAEVRRARELNPLNPLAAVLESSFLYRAGRPEDARARLEALRAQDPRFWLARISLARTYLILGLLGESLDEARAALELSPDSSYTRATEIHALARLGRREEARQRLDELQLRARERYVPPYDLALAFISLGDEAQAMAQLGVAFQMRDPKLSFLAVEPQWSGLRSHPGFADLLARMNLAGVSR